MTTSAAMTGERPGAEPEVRRAYRDLDEGLIGGVAAGLGAHLGISVLVLRVLFLLTAAAGGLGLLLYAAYWLLLPAAPEPAAATPGLAGATRDGRRPRSRRPIANVGQAVIIASLALGAVLAVEAVVGRGALVWALALVVAGVVLLWRQADEAQRERIVQRTESLDPVGIVLGSGGWAAYSRLLLGAALLWSGLIVLLLRDGGITAAREVLVALALAIGGLLLVIGPWVVRLVHDLGAERAERIRSQERADVAAHLHDSVLQTLALIQKNAHDPAVVSRLARSQERDLRTWLFSEERGDGEGGTFAEAIAEIRARVEAEHEVEVEVVTVGNIANSAALAPLLAASREAIVNAAKHAGVPRIDVYAEVDAEAIEVFVRDRGVGFDPEGIDDDRHGVRGSILERMTRHGGTAQIRSSATSGTEVRLRLPRPAETGEPDPSDPSDPSDPDDEETSSL